MSNRPHRTRQPSWRSAVPRRDRDMARDLAEMSKAAHGCTCDWTGTRHRYDAETGIPLLSVTHDDDCPALGARPALFVWQWPSGDGEVTTC